MRFHIYAIVFVTFCALKGIECNSSPLKKISQILATTEFRKCYSCEGACETPLTQYCEANNKCFSSSTKTGKKNRFYFSNDSTSFFQRVAPLRPKGALQPPCLTPYARIIPIPVTPAIPTFVTQILKTQK
jgi:hypothetical protein